KLSYEPNETGYNVKVEGAFGWKTKDVKGVIVDGELLTAEAYTVSGDAITFPVDSGKMFIYEAPKKLVPETANSWKFISSATDNGLFTSTVSLPATSNDGSHIDFSGQTKIFKWVYSGSAGISTGIDGATYIASTKNGNYHDMSAWQSIRFSIYVPESLVGATMRIQFDSDDPSTQDANDVFRSNITLNKSGWNEIILNKDEIGILYYPIGWDKITRAYISLTHTQNITTSAELYVSDITAYDCNLNVDRKNSVAEYSKENNAAVFALNGYAGSINGKTYKINPTNIESKVFKEGDVVYLPVNVFAVSIDDGAAYYGKSGIVTYVYDGVKYTFSPGNTYKVGAEYRELTYPAIHRNGGLFISAQDAMAIYEYENIFEDRMGIVILSNSAIELDAVEDQETIFEYVKKLVYVRPTGDDMYRDLMEHSVGQHPYIMVDSQDFADLRYYLKNDATLQSYVSSLIKTHGIGSVKFNEQPQWFRLADGKRLLSIVDDVMYKMMSWGLLYQLDIYEGAEKQQLIDRVWEEAEALANYYDKDNRLPRYGWNPDHYLDVGEGAVAMAVAYDWFYDEWTPEQRSQMAKSLYEYGLTTTSVLSGGGNYRILNDLTNNWNGVCNAGIMCASLAIANDEYIVSNGLQDEVIHVMDYCIEAIESGMWVYGPDGGYEEGPGYWSGGTMFTMIFISSVEAACGTTYGIYDTPGFEESAYFTTYLGNANTTWGFHDASSADSNPAIAAWFAGISGDGNLNAIRRQGIEKGWCSASIYDIIYFNPHIIANSINLSLDSYYSLDTLMTFRSSWDTSNNIFAGLHGGDNSAGHGDLDIGNFVINVNGVFMIDELGNDAYNVAGYFENTYRWSYYRKRTEGQNCLVMIGHGDSWNDKTGRPEYYIDANNNVVKEPEKAKYVVSKGKKYNLTASNGIGTVVDENYGNTHINLPDPNYYGQKLTAVSRATAFESGVSSAYGVVDMKPAYAAAKGDMIRGLYMTNNRSTVVIQDEGTFNAYQDIWWFAHTRGEITVSADGSSAIIFRDGIYLYAEIVVDPNNPIDAKFSTMDWESLDENYVGDTVKSGLYVTETEVVRDGKKLVVTAENTKVFNCAVAFKQIQSLQDVPEKGTIYTWTAIKDWKAE
ncbi:MAG: hypothetical protein IKB51_05870, partial [Clostridia bacterium]|nr:hypothetical protein [Clostridia bacterium]